MTKRKSRHFPGKKGDTVSQLPPQVTPTLVTPLESMEFKNYFKSSVSNISVTFKQPFPCFITKLYSWLKWYLANWQRTLHHN